jgi:DNA-binding response OmpR family regulator
VPILMTAGSGHKQRVVKARDAGVSDYLVKPFTARQLAMKIETIVERPRPFVVCHSYVGPNRRIRELPFLGVDKRTDEPVFRKYASA